MFYLEHLRTQLNFLSLGRLNPSTISPSNLRALLLEIKAHLPPTLALIGDPKQDLWLFYRQLRSSALLGEKRIVVIIRIPLLCVHNQYEIYQVFNLPIPVENLRTDNVNAPDMITKYNLESEGLMIDKSKTRYALLTRAETEICSDSSVKYCNVQSPIYPVNLARLCVVNLFLQKPEAVKKYCESIVTLNTRLPFAVKLMNFLWGIISQTELRFSVVCNNGQSKTETSKPPIDILEVPAACVASNDYFILASSYHSRSDFTITDGDLELLRSIDISQINVLTPLQKKYPNFTKITLPKSLQPIKDIPLDNLITELENTREIKLKDDAWPSWVYVCIGVTVVLLIIMAIYICKMYDTRIKQSCSFMYENCRSHESVNTKPDPGVSTTIDNPELDCGGSVPSAPVETLDVCNINKLYPMLCKVDKTEDTRL